MAGESSPVSAVSSDSTVWQCEANGNVAVATLHAGCITVIAPDGKVVRQVAMPDEFPTNICFGGADMRTAYVTLSATGRLGALDWDEPGLRLNF